MSDNEKIIVPVEILESEDTGGSEIIQTVGRLLRKDDAEYSPNHTTERRRNTMSDNDKIIIPVEILEDDESDTEKEN